VTSGFDRRAHWDRVFAERGPTGVSWYEQSPRMSLEMIDLAGTGPHEAALDVGGGASPLAGALLARGFDDLTVLDVSEVALQTARGGLGPAGARVRWIRADVLDWIPSRTYGLWHDRAVFHFLVDVESRERYLATARSALRSGGHAVIGTFAEDGPTTCSGLPVARYDAQAVAGALGPEFNIVGSRRDEHRTPSGTIQPFTWVTLQRRCS
jgi:SAM-dependent methyltransferase